MDLKVDTDGLRADGGGLSALAGSAGGAPQCDPAAADPVSMSVAATLTQWSHVLWTLMQHAGQQRLAGGVSLTATAGHLGEIDDANTASIANAGAGGSPGHSVPSSPVPAVAAPIPVPALPPIPEVSSPPPLTGEQVSALVHAGPGPDRLRAFAQHWRSTVAPHILATADETRRYGTSIQQHWDNGDPQAARNVLEHADWLESALHASVLRLADSADQAASHVETVIQTTPPPEEFHDTRSRFAAALANFRASGGLNVGPVITLNNQLAGMQGTAVVGYQTFAASAPVATIGAPPAPAPPIVRGGGQAATLDPQINDPRVARREGDHGASDRPGKGAGGDTLQPTTADFGPVGSAGTPPAGPAQPGIASTPGTAASIAGTIMGAGLGTVGQLATSMQGMTGGGSPLSSLSGLSSIPGLGAIPNTGLPHMPSGPGDGGGASAPDLGNGDDFGADGTIPASGGGDGGGGAPTSSSSPAVSGGPAASAPGVGAPAGVAPAAAPAGVGGGAGMFPPPMMGGLGPHDEQGRKVDDKRRVVMRPVPNTEPVFGEVERKRPPRRPAHSNREGEPR